MGSGISLVTACSFSLNGPVAMAAPQRPAPPHPKRMESDRPIRAGRCDMQSAVITALRREEPGRGHHTPAGSQQDPSPNKRDEPGAPRVMCAPRARHSQPSITCGTCYQEQLAVIPVKSEQYKLHHPEGSGHTSNADRLIVLRYSVSEIFITCHTYSFAVIRSSLPLWEKHVTILLNTPHGDAAGEGRI